MTLDPIPLLRVTMNASVGAIVAVAAIGLVLWPGLDISRRWLAGWLILDATASLVELLGRYVLKNSHYVAHAWYPLSAGVAVAMLASATSPLWPRRRQLVAAGAVTALMAVLTLVVERPGTTARLTGAMHGMILLGTGATLILSRLRRAERDMLTDSHFLAGAGFMLVGAPSALLTPAARAFGPVALDLQLATYAIKNLLTMVGYLVMVAALHPPRSEWIRADGRAQRWE